MEADERTLCILYSSSFPVEGKPSAKPSPRCQMRACCRRKSRQRAPRSVETWPKSHGPQCRCALVLCSKNGASALVCPLVACLPMSGTDDGADEADCDLELIYDFAEVCVRPTEHRAGKRTIHTPGCRLRVSKKIKDKWQSVWIF